MQVASAKKHSERSRSASEQSLTQTTRQTNPDCALSILAIAPRLNWPIEGPLQEAASRGRFKRSMNHELSEEERSLLSLKGLPSFTEESL